MAVPEPAEEDLDALSHVDSEQGDVPQAELEDMRKRIRRGDMDIKRLLRWIDDAAEVGRSGQQQLQREQQREPQPQLPRPRRPNGEEELGFVGGKREVQREGEVPYGRACPALGARIEVEFQDAIYCGTVTVRRAKTVCTVKFDADSDEVDIRCGQHRFREIRRAEPETGTARERSDRAPASAKVAATAEIEPRCTPPKRKRGTGSAAALATSEPADDSAASCEDSLGAVTASPGVTTNGTPSGSVATSESSLPQSSGSFAVPTSPDEETGDVQLSQATAELVGGVTHDLDASLAQIGMFLEADCAEKEGMSS